MPRPSLAPERRAQILDGVERCIIKYGLNSVTYERIADETGVQPSLIPHYFGSKQAVMSAAVERTLDNVIALVDDIVGEAEGPELVTLLLDLVFSGALTIPQIGQMADELIAASYFNEETRVRLMEMYQRLDQLAVGAIRQAYPHVPVDQADAVGYGLLLIADAHNTFTSIGFGPDYNERARNVAERLIATLD